MQGLGGFTSMRLADSGSLSVNLHGKQKRCSSTCTDCVTALLLPAGDLQQHSAMLARLRKGRYSGEPVLDYLENKATKALYITAQHIVYVNLGRQSVRWALSLRHLFSVTTAGDLLQCHSSICADGCLQPQRGESE